MHHLYEVVEDVLWPAFLRVPQVYRRQITTLFYQIAQLIHTCDDILCHLNSIEVRFCPLCGFCTFSERDKPLNCALRSVVRMAQTGKSSSGRRRSLLVKKDETVADSRSILGSPVSKPERLLHTPRAIGVNSPFRLDLPLTVF